MIHKLFIAAQRSCRRLVILLQIHVADNNEPTHDRLSGRKEARGGCGDSLRNKPCSAAQVSYVGRAAGWLPRVDTTCLGQHLKDFLELESKQELLLVYGCWGGLGARRSTRVGAQMMAQARGGHGYLRADGNEKRVCGRLKVRGRFCAYQICKSSSRWSWYESIAEQAYTFSLHLGKQEALKSW